MLVIAKDKAWYARVIPVVGDIQLDEWERCVWIDAITGAEQVVPGRTSFKIVVLNFPKQVARLNPCYHQILGFFIAAIVLVDLD